MSAVAEIAYVRPWLYDKQRDAIFCPERYGVTEASTKAGKTVGCIVWLFEQALQGEQGHHYWWIAPSYRQTKIAYQRLKLYLREYRDVFTSNDSALMVKLVVGTTISFLSGEKPDLLYGEDVYAVVMDEATRMREEAWHAVRTTITATHGPVRIIGNVKGRKNWAFVMARKAEQGAPGMHYAKLIAKDAVDAGILTQDEVDDARNQLPESVFNELYNAVPSEDGGNPFGLQHIAACVARYHAGGAPVVWGWDLARRVDYTVGVAVDKQGNVCRLDRFQESWPRTRERVVAAVGRTPAVVEINSVGDPLLEEITRHGAHDNFRGFITSATSKQQIMEGLAAAIQKHDLGIPDGQLRKELESFEYVVTRTTDGRVRTYYSAPEGLHDDCVIALAIAWSHFRKAPTLVMPVSLTKRSLWK